MFAYDIVINKELYLKIYMYTYIYKCMWNHICFLYARPQTHIDTWTERERETVYQSSPREADLKHSGLMSW